MSLHYGRSFNGHPIEDVCLCVQAPCGLVDSATVEPDCPEHAMWATKTIRQGHQSHHCPSKE